MKRWILVIALYSGCASGPQPASGGATNTTQATDRLEADRQVAAALRAVTARVRRGEASEVRAELTEKANANPRDLKVKLYQAWVGAPGEEAWQQINTLSKLNPEEPWLAVCSGLIYLQWRGFVAQAEGDFRKALTARPNFVAARVGLADVLRHREKYEEAKAAYQAVLQEAPDWQEALVGLGLTQVALGEEAGRATLERAMERDPEDVVAVTALARLALQRKDGEAAIGLYEKMLQYDPRDRDARLALARMKEQKSDDAGAAVHYEKALEVAPDVASAAALAGCYRRLQKAEDELRALDKLAQLDAKNPAPLLRVAELKKAEGDPEAAEQALRQAAERSPDDATLQVAIARLVKEREDLVGAIEAYRLARAKGAADIAAELKAAEASAFLPEKPFAGNVNRVYQELFVRLRRQYLERQKQNKALGGKLKVRVTIAEDGKASLVEMLEDSVHDDVLRALVYYGLKDANYPKEKRTPTFEFVLSGS